MSSISRLSFRNTNQVRRIQASGRLRQNSSRRSHLLQEQKETESENLQSTPETMSLESDSFIKVTLSQ